MKVSEVMHTPVVSIGPHATLREAAELMDARNVGCLVVVDHLGYLTGIVTDRDITIRGVGVGRSCDAPVESVMTRDVATVSPNADVSAAQATMQKRAVRRVPVADDMWRPHGMISMDDILGTFGHEFDAMTDMVNAQGTHVGH
jgi:signal-transduction protein with cAMP-binding, CBS, and nucleotidyltransferase domain